VASDSRGRVDGKQRRERRKEGRETHKKLPKQDRTSFQPYQLLLKYTCFHPTDPFYRSKGEVSSESSQLDLSSRPLSPSRELSSNEDMWRRRTHRQPAHVENGSLMFVFGFLLRLTLGVGLVESDLEARGRGRREGGGGQLELGRGRRRARLI